MPLWMVRREEEVAGGVVGARRRTCEAGLRTASTSTSSAIRHVEVFNLFQLINLFHILALKKSITMLVGPSPAPGL